MCSLSEIQEHPRQHATTKDSASNVKHRAVGSKLKSGAIFLVDEEHPTIDIQHFFHTDIVLQQHNRQRVTPDICQCALDDC